MDKIPASGELYRHFKNKLYQVITVAGHSETGESLVIYQALYGDFLMYARPLEMFMSEVDHEKYPDVSQKYRFEKVERTVPKEEKDICKTNDSETTGLKAEYGEGVVDPKLMAFLDTDDFDERYHILVSMQSTMSDKLVNNLAVVLDVVIPEGELDDRYEALKQCVRTRQRYESTRLRS